MPHTACGCARAFADTPCLITSSQLTCVQNTADPTIHYDPPSGHSYDPASARFGWLQANSSWAYDNATLSDLLARHVNPAGLGPLLSLDTMRVPRSPTNDSVPAEWDAPCEAGGRRRWDALTNCDPMAAPDDPWLQSCRDQTYAWGGTRCECPEGRAGLTCVGCSADAGCADGFQCDIRGMSADEEVIASDGF